MQKEVRGEVWRVWGKSRYEGVLGCGGNMGKYEGRCRER